MSDIGKKIENKVKGNLGYKAQEVNGGKGTSPTYGWAYFNSPIFDYEKTFEGLLDPEESLQSIVDSANTRFGKSTVADLMGTGVKDLKNVTNGLNVSLGYPLNLEIPRENFVEGDLFSLKTWKEIDMWLKKRDERNFNLIISRPLGGLPSSSDDFDIYFLLLRRAYRRLNPNGGIMLFEIPTLQLRKKTLDEWISKLKGENMDIQSNKYALFLKRNPESSHNLPK